ncbi:MAG: transcription-repair coupling factor [Phycisphaerales bacterium]|nr:transcription-repair coupling factor [Phycisphaerales bacterium]
MRCFDALLADPRITRVAEALKAQRGVVAAEGLWGSCAPILAGAVAQQLNRPLLLLTAHADDADDSRDDIETALGATPELFPQLETLPGEADPDDEVVGERMRIAMAVSGRASGTPRWLTAPIHAVMQAVPSPEAIAAQSFSLGVGEAVDPERLVAWLAEQGFSRCDQVEAPGDFARRGGIIDAYSHAHRNPLRVEFFGDEIESIRIFDAGTQRSIESLTAVSIPALRVRAAALDVTTNLLELLPADTIIALREPLEIQEMGRAYFTRLNHPKGIYPVEAVFRLAAQRSQLFLERFAGQLAESIAFETQSLPQFEARGADALKHLSELAADRAVFVICDSAPEAERFEELMRELPERPAGVRTAVGLLHRGFVWGDVAYVPNHEIFHREFPRRRLRRVAPARPIDSFFDLNPGDYVVHTIHGIGKFVGLRGMERADSKDEYLVIEFASKAVVNVPTSQIHLVQKYIGSGRGKPALSKLGTSAWKRTKDRVSEAVSDLAAELLSIQAARATQAGIAYPHDTQWQREFEGSFPYQETEDQLKSLAEIKNDMQSVRPMDRLLCGDVGFGKTELAIRAAFKVVEYGKQVAVLVPTTVLAEQHFRSFRARFADYPFRIEGLSRFKTKPEQAKIVDAARRGDVDILIGTHRLLSQDVHFSDLGLVVIDEEQRFGVDAKEKLKRLRATVDVLTLSATPIPRTLHMALVGIRDISSLATPPLDRRAIVTQVRPWDDKVIREAIVRELSREGQIYFVHNFVKDIHNIANAIRALVPDARVVVGHGQMDGSELEEVMLAFLERRADVLVSTNIIESGLDIPSANTIFINRADRFGLADLHQLRGRVGRSKHRAYAYMLLPRKTPLTEKAARRLKAIERYSELGSGFQIAMRDLEIRGAGNILGPEQSGQIEAVGYEMYCQLLAEATRRLRGETVDPYRPVGLDLGLNASIPRSYVHAEKQRMEIYKRLTACRTPADIQALRGDLADAFGAPPRDVETLISLAEIRVLARAWGVRSITLREPDVIFSIDDLQAVQPLFAEGPGSPRTPDGNTIHWRLPKRLLAPELLVATLLRQLKAVSERAATVRA